MEIPAHMITTASLGVSGDGMWIYGLTDTIFFRYSVSGRGVRSMGYTSSPTFGPRAVASNHDGSAYTMGWGLFDRLGNLIAQYTDPLGALSTGGFAFDSRRNIIWGQVPNSAQANALPNVLNAYDGDNLAILERYQMAENLAGKGILSSDGETAYIISDSGVTVFPVGSLERQRRVLAASPDLVFRANSCDRGLLTQDLVLTDPSGNATDFTLTPSSGAIMLSQTSGVTPAVIRVAVNPASLQNFRGTQTATINVTTASGINAPFTVRVIIAAKDPDQRGTSFNVPGKLVDILADPVRDRFFILRQDRNQVLVFDATSYRQIATLKTGNTPTQLALTFDKRYLLVGNNDSNIAQVYDLDTLQASNYIVFPLGHYPRSLAAAGDGIIAAVRRAGTPHKIDRVDFFSRTATEFPTLGVYENDIDPVTVLVAAGNGASVMAASANGSMMLYDSNAGTFTVSRKDSSALSGGYAASSFGHFVVGNTLYNQSLVKVASLDAASGDTSGFAFIDQLALRTTATGVIQRVDPASGRPSRSSRIAEAPVAGEASLPFTRTVAVLYNRSAIINLTVSGFTVLPWTYDAAAALPKITAVVNAADGERPIAPGSLIRVLGQDLSPINATTRQLPLPTALGESCLTVNGIPVPMILVSGNQINAQMPYQVEGNATVMLRTPGGVSDNYNLSVQSTAPGIFRTQLEGLPDAVPTIVRAANKSIATGSNPIHRNDHVVVFLTGLGKTSPAVESGSPAPLDPPAAALVEPVVTLGGVPIVVSYAGLVPGEVGVYQINARVPGHVPTGREIPFTITQGGAVTTVNVRVID
ncbi:MAG: hypothetical protein FJW40_26390 [Acidobacteria bacterium]|nr:hypothetical protein [Acidobacteriota bacterium]